MLPPTMSCMALHLLPLPLVFPRLLLLPSIHMTAATWTTVFLEHSGTSSLRFSPLAAASPWGTVPTYSLGSLPHLFTVFTQRPPPWGLLWPSSLKGLPTLHLLVTPCPHSLVELFFPKHSSPPNVLYNLLTYFLYFLYYPRECKLSDGSDFFITTS